MSQDDCRPLTYAVTSEEVFGDLSRYVVQLQAVDEDESTREVSAFCATGLLVHVEGVPLFVTAGHVISDIVNRLAGDRRLKICRLADRGTFEARRGDGGIPIDFRALPKLGMYDEDSGFDCGALPLHGIQAQAMRNGGARFWHWQQGESKQQCVAFSLLGFPTKYGWTAFRSVEMGVKTTFGSTLVSLSLEEVDPPQRLILQHPRRVFRVMPGHLRDRPEDTVQDVSGMSGGPVFGFVQSSKTKMRPVLIGIQSTQLGEDGFKCVCSVDSFLAQLASEIRRLKQRESAP